MLSRYRDWKYQAEQVDVFLWLVYEEEGPWIGGGSGKRQDHLVLIVKLGPEMVISSMFDLKDFIIFLYTFKYVDLNV